MYTSENFTFNGRNSLEFDLYLVKLDSGINEQQMGLKRSITGSKQGNKNNRYKDENEILTFEVSLAKIEEPLEITLQDRIKINEWLFQDDYKELVFDNERDIVYYAKAIQINRSYNYMEQGYITITFECNSAYPCLRETIHYYEHSSVTNTTIVDVFNYSNLEQVYPMIEFTLSGTTTFSIKNLTDNGREFKFTELLDGETVSIDNQRKLIISDRNVSRYSKFNKQWLRLLKGNNRLEISGNCTVEIVIPETPILV